MSELNSKKTLTEALESIWITKAMLDDYCNVVAKIENISPQEIRNRILLKADTIKDEWSLKYKDSLPQS